MKTLSLLRHAKSDWQETSIRDFDRPLNEKGRRVSRAMGHWAASQKLRFDHIVASPAVRVMETLDEFIIEGIKTTVPFHQKLMKDERFRKGDFHTGFLNTFTMGDK